MKSRGFTLLYAVLAVALLLSAVLSITSIVIKQLTIASVGQQSQIAFYAADSGAECMHYWDSKHNAFDPDDPLSPIKCGGTNLTMPTMIVDSSGVNLKKTATPIEFKPDSTRQPQSTIEVIKQDIFHTTIRSSGHNIAQTSPRKVERTLVLDYTPAPSELCFNDGIVSVLVDFHNLPNIKSDLQDFAHKLLEPADSGPREVGVYAYNASVGNGTNENITGYFGRDGVETLDNAINELRFGNGSGPGDIAAAIDKVIKPGDQGGFGKKGPAHYILLITGNGPGSSNLAAVESAANNAKTHGSDTSAMTSIYTIGFNLDKNTTECGSVSCGEFFEKKIAGDYTHNSSMLTPTNRPYSYRYSHIVRSTPSTLPDFKAVLASLANCR